MYTVIRVLNELNTNGNVKIVDKKFIKSNYTDEYIYRSYLFSIDDDTVQTKEETIYFDSKEDVIINNGKSSVYTLCNLEDYISFIEKVALLLTKDLMNKNDYYVFSEKDIFFIDKSSILKDILLLIRSAIDLTEKEYQKIANCDISEKENVIFNIIYKKLIMYKDNKLDSSIYIDYLNSKINEVKFFIENVCDYKTNIQLRTRKLDAI